MRDDKVFSRIAAHCAACATRDFAFAQIDVIDEREEPASLKDFTTAVNAAEGAVFAELISEIPTSAIGWSALILHLEELEGHQLGPWHLPEASADDLIGRLIDDLKKSDAPSAAIAFELGRKLSLDRAAA